MNKWHVSAFSMCVLSATAAMAGSNSDKIPKARMALANEAVSKIGLRASLDRVSDQLIESFEAGYLATAPASRATLGEAELAEVERALLESYNPHAIAQGIAEALAADPDADTMLRGALISAGSPAVQKLVGLSAKPPTRQELAAISARGVTAERSRRIRDLDEAARLSEVALHTQRSANRAVVFGGICSKWIAAFDAAYVKNQAKLDDASRAGARVTLAAAYRDAADEDIDEYARVAQSKAMQWFFEKAYKAMAVEFGHGGDELNARLRAISDRHPKALAQMGCHQQGVAPAALLSGGRGPLAASASPPPGTPAPTPARPALAEPAAPAARSPVAEPAAKPTAPAPVAAAPGAVAGYTEATPQPQPRQRPTVVGYRSFYLP